MKKTLRKSTFSWLQRLLRLTKLHQRSRPNRLKPPSLLKLTTPSILLSWEPMPKLRKLWQRLRLTMKKEGLELIMRPKLLEVKLKPDLTLHKISQRHWSSRLMQKQTNRATWKAKEDTLKKWHYLMPFSSLDTLETWSSQARKDRTFSITTQQPSIELTKDDL